jgi:hypothetical protein
MRFDPGHESPDVIDRRGKRSGLGGGGLGGILALLPLLGRSKLGWVILLVIIAITVAGGLGIGTTDGPADRAAQTRTTGANDPKQRA